MLEQGEENIQLARQLYKCAVKADPSSERSWLVRVLLASHCPPHSCKALPSTQLQGTCKVVLSKVDAQLLPRHREPRNSLNTGGATPVVFRSIHHCQSWQRLQPNRSITPCTCMWRTLSALYRTIHYRPS